MDRDERIFDEARFTEGAFLLGIDCLGDQIKKFEAYSRELQMWNGRMNLVGGDLADFTERHLLDCLAGLPVIKNLPHASIADIGSGAGLPGIPLAIMLPESSVTLVERSGKKAGFLRNCAALLGLGNVVVEEGPWENAAGGFDILTCRAFADLGVILRAAERLLKPGGAVVAYKGRKEEIERELRDAGAKHAGIQTSIIPVTAPFLEEERCIVVMYV